MWGIDDIVKRQYSSVANYKEGNYGGREKSWDWCHDAFVNNKDKKDDKTIDTLALFLFAYLGSFGMLRGSSKLLNCDYKYLKKLIQNHILDPDYKELFNVDPLNTETDDEKVSKLIFGAGGIYGRIESYFGKKVTSTDTLVTKILLGTYGCIPAYDRFLKEGIKHHIIHYNSNNNTDFKGDDKVRNNSTNVYKNLADFYRNNVNKFKSIGINYPPMKLVDMYFNELGYELSVIDDIEKTEKKQKAIEKLEELGIVSTNDILTKETILKKYQQ